MAKGTMIKHISGKRTTGKWKPIPDFTITKNGVEEKTLRDWQNELLQACEETDLPHVFINCPTGAGKSVAALAVLTRDEKTTNNLIIISTPQKEIGKGFLRTTGNLQKVLDHEWMISAANHLCENSYRNEDGNVAQLKSFLTAPRLADINERVLICCHATLSLLFDRMSSAERTKYFKNVRLCVDESHHSLSQDEVGNGLGKVVGYFLRHSDKNLKLLMMTATPFRGDKGSLVPEKYLKQFCTYDLDYGRHFEENCDGLEFTYSAVLHQHGRDYGLVIKDLMTELISEGRKVLIQIPPSNRKGISRGKDRDLLMMYDAIGEEQTVDKNGIVLINHNDTWIRVLDLVTVDGRERRLDYLRKNPDDIDVVIGIAVIKEGFDWPPANAGILIGSQGSLNAQIQLMGRMFRAYKNKGSNKGQSPVQIYQVFPYVDYEKLDSDGVKEQLNTLLKAVYAALAMELVINPIHVVIPTKSEDGKKLTRHTVKDFLREHLTDTQHRDFIADVMDEYRDWRALNPDSDETYQDKITEIVSDRLTELGITEHHKEVIESIDKLIQRSAKFQLIATKGIDVSHIDLELMHDLEDPISSILMGWSNGLCGAKDIREFQLLMKPVDTLRRCMELKEWVEKKNRWPMVNSKDSYEKSLYNLMACMREAKRGNGKSKITQEHIEALESIEGWSWGRDPDKVLKRIDDLEKFIKTNNRWPRWRSKNLIERSLSNFIKTMRDAKRGNGKSKITQEHIEALESIEGWSWNKDPDKVLKRIDDLEKFIKTHNRFPGLCSKDPIEKSLYLFIRSRRAAKKGNGDYILTQEHIEALESIEGWEWEPNMDKTLKRVDDLEEFIKTYNRFPLCSKDPIEKSLYLFIKSMRAAKKGKGSCKTTQAHIEALEGIEGWEWQPKTDKTLKRVDDLKDFIGVNNRWPSEYSKDPIEKSLCGLTRSMRRAKRGTGSCKITQAHIEALESIPGWSWGRES